jgi:hypothetical protein
MSARPLTFSLPAAQGAIGDASMPGGQAQRGRKAIVKPHA